MNFQKPMYTIAPSGDYFQVGCMKCGEACKLDFKGFDPSIPLIEVICPKCGSSGARKLDRAGLGFYRNAKRKQRRLDRVMEAFERQRRAKLQGE